jgi:hypothetical protein
MIYVRNILYNNFPLQLSSDLQEKDKNIKIPKTSKNGLPLPSLEKEQITLLNLSRKLI